MTGNPPLIIGGGPAGAACAIHLARGGEIPTIIERAREPRDALCGGFLSWRTLEQVAQLGISPEQLGGHGITCLRIVSGSSSQVVSLPQKSMAVSRRRLDSLLLQRARELGALVRHDVARFDAGHIRLEEGDVLDYDSLFLATGKHELRGLQRPRDAAGGDPMSGLRWRIAPDPRLHVLLEHHIELHLFAGGYAGLVLHEDGSANLCMAVRKSRLARAKGDPEELIAQLAEDNPTLAERLDFLTDTARFDAIGHIPYHWRATESREGIFRLGDQAGVIASLAGEGIGIALASAAAAVRCWRLAGAASAPAFQAGFAARSRRPLAAARLVAGMGQNRLSARLLTSLATIPGAMALVYNATRI